MSVSKSPIYRFPYIILLVLPCFALFDKSSGREPGEVGNAALAEERTSKTVSAVFGCPWLDVEGFMKESTLSAIPLDNNRIRLFGVWGMGGKVSHDYYSTQTLSHFGLAHQQTLEDYLRSLTLINSDYPQWMSDGVFVGLYGQIDGRKHVYVFLNPSRGLNIQDGRLRSAVDIADQLAYYLAYQKRKGALGTPKGP